MDFAQYRRWDYNEKNNNWKEQRYAVYLTFPLARDSTNVVERVDLGEAAPINAAVELVCQRMSAGQFTAKDLSPALQRLSQLVYAPLAPYLTNVSHVIHATNLFGRSSRREEAQTSSSQLSTNNPQLDSHSLLTSAATRLDEEDGLLTGLEASLLNLQGTELVILSACDSGTGEVKIG